MVKKGLLHAIVKSFQKKPSGDRATPRVVSPAKDKPHRVQWRVTSLVEPITYDKQKHANSLYEMLQLAGKEPAIIRVETTHDGYIIDERKIK